MKTVKYKCNICKQEFELPEGTYKKLIDKNSSWLWKNDNLWSTITGKGTQKCSGKITLAASSMTVLGRKDV